MGVEEREKTRMTAVRNSGRHHPEMKKTTGEWRWAGGIKRWHLYRGCLQSLPGTHILCAERCQSCHLIHTTERLRPRRQAYGYQRGKAGRDKLEYWD